MLEKERAYLVRGHMLDYSGAIIYMSIRNWASGKLCSDEFLVPVHPAKNFANAPGHPVFPQKTNHAFNRIACVNTGKFSRVRTTGY